MPVSASSAEPVKKAFTLLGCRGGRACNICSIVIATPFRN